MADVCQIAATHADSVGLIHILGNSHQCGHRSERYALKVHIQTGTDNADTALGEFGADLHDAHVEELRLVDTYHVNVVCQQQDRLARLHGRGLNDIVIVGNDVLLAVAHINSRLEDLHTLLGKLRTFHPTDEFFCLTGEHTAAYNLYTAATQCRSLSVSFVEHILVILVYRLVQYLPLSFAGK